MSTSVVGLVLAATLSLALGRSEEPVDLFERIDIIFQELISFKDAGSFAKYGFGAGDPHHEWLSEAKAVRDSKVSVPSFMRDYEFVPGDLLQLRMSYLDSKGEETSRTRDTRATLESAFAWK